jgi:hypothetical protein
MDVPLTSTRKRSSRISWLNLRKEAVLRKRVRGAN